MANKRKVSIKNLITIGIFSVITSVLFRLAAMISVFAPVLFPFCSAIGMLLCGVVWVFLLAKIPQKFCVSTLCTVVALLSYATGAIWTIALGIFIGGLAAELICGLGNPRSFIVSAAAYSTFGMFLHLGIVGIIFFANGYWRHYVTKFGVPETYIDTISKTLSLPSLGLSSAAVVLCSVLGILLGNRILKKHFIKAGLV